MAKEYTKIDGTYWKCCITQKDRVCSKCGRPILKGTHYLYFKVDPYAYPTYRCTTCAPQPVRDWLGLSQTTMQLPWITVTNKPETREFDANDYMTDRVIMVLPAKGHDIKIIKEPSLASLLREKMEE